MILRIREWDKNFENAGSRKLKRLEWVAIPNKTDGEGYTAQRVSGVMGLVIELKLSLQDANTRSNLRIARCAKEALTLAQHFPPDSVMVMVESGWITLTGRVDWQYQRDKAEACVRDIVGVTGVSNHIDVRQLLCTNVVKSEIESALQRRATEDANAISVHVKGSVVTLSGTIRNWPERVIANQSARNTPGVYVVLDTMTLYA